LPNEIRTFFRHCPACGHRFQVRLISEKEIPDSESVTDATMPPISMNYDTTSAPRSGEKRMIHLDDSADTTVVDSKRELDTYRCGHCGHVWTEVREQNQRLHVPEDVARELTEHDGSAPKSPRAGTD
jgi:transcription elongation factor Elf1